jgi:protein TonB
MNSTFIHSAEMGRAQARRWTFGFFLVLAAHVLAVVTLLNYSPQSAVPAPVQAIEVSFARFAPPLPIRPIEPIPEPKPEIAAVEVPNAEPIVTKHKERKPERKQRPKLEQTPLRPEIVEKPAKQLPPPDSVADLHINQAAAPADADLSAGRSNPGPRPDYLAILAAWLEKHKEYPRRARLRGQEGRVTLGFVINRSGRVLSYRIQNGSGYEILDRAVEDMIQRAQPLPPMPDDLHEQQIDVVVPVQFSLR